MLRACERLCGIGSKCAASVAGQGECASGLFGVSLGSWSFLEFFRFGLRSSLAFKGNVMGCGTSEEGLEARIVAGI